MRRSKHAWLWAQLDALERFETWFVSTDQLPFLSTARGKYIYVCLYNRRGAPKMALHSVEGGVLFVRLV